jgi:DNA-binding response OmpR family regulator
MASGTCGRIAPAVRALVVEDEKKTASFIRKALRAEGFAVDVCHNGDDALHLATTVPYDALVLDIMLPGRDGLNAGADDYLPKPFALAELVARVRAMGRRAGEARATVLQVADLTLDTVTRVARRGEAQIELTAREYRLLEFLMRSPGRICARMTILEKVWDYDFDPGTNLVDVYVRRLRDKVDTGYQPKLIHTVRGVGYVLREAP